MLTHTVLSTTLTALRSLLPSFQTNVVLRDDTWVIGDSPATPDQVEDALTLDLIRALPRDGFNLHYSSSGLWVSGHSPSTPSPSLLVAISGALARAVEFRRKNKYARPSRL